MRRALANIIVFAMACSAASLNAMPIIYSDRATFISQLDTSITDDYERLEYRNGDIANALGLHIHSDAHMNAVLNETRYLPTRIPNHNVIAATDITLTEHYYCAGCNGSYLLDFTSTSIGDATGVFGVGFDILFNLGNPFYTAFITFGDGSTMDITFPFANPNAPLFFGVTFEKNISTIHFGLPGGQLTTTGKAGNFAQNDLTIGSTITPVPEPASLALLGLGLAGLGFMRLLMGGDLVP